MSWCGNFEEILRFHEVFQTRKLGEIMVYYAVEHWLNCRIFVQFFGSETLTPHTSRYPSILIKNFYFLKNEYEFLHEIFTLLTKVPYEHIDTP